MSYARLGPRVCSARKTGKARGFPCEQYDAPMLPAFFKTFPRGHAVLSRKLGICVSWRRYDRYGDCDEKPDGEILALLREQAWARRQETSVHTIKNPKIYGLLLYDH